MALTDLPANSNSLGEANIALLGPIRIGPIEIRNPLLLGPMAGVSDFPFREIARRQGAGLCVSEMVTSKTELWHTRKSSSRLPSDKDPAPRPVQIAGAEPKAMAEAAKKLVDLGAGIIDINMGCPAKKVCAKAAGSALLADEKLVAQILEAVVQSVDVPVTLKTRTGIDPNNKNAVRIARLAESIGIQALTLHGRTRACRFRGKAEYETIAKVVLAVSIPVIANGDIDSPHKAQEVLIETGAAGLMIGRGAWGRPWLFRQIREHLNGQPIKQPSLNEIQDVISAHIQLIHETFEDNSGIGFVRKHVDKYLNPFDPDKSFRRMFNQLDSGQSQVDSLNTFFTQQQHSIFRAA